jgi:hypothetical protein
MSEEMMVEHMAFSLGEIIIHDQYSNGDDVHSLVDELMDRGRFI